ncbi:Upstream stimulatory factor 1 [Wickerhamomyces ciferrii]|uniref:Upstream stimulatory factor 1 n=1 Tax=Wickerhamomyces ciferrii (strain ATCC 14091 / BCRC 22168 / CBS 111 / JCM 3599 / NBRC 0793 / NRRL Y-1031 F-60-10) TaxID=1206466 RepID=K0KYK5_WICCF|nr:Upstream stimulatory factor 1 [Wickerhamomyces ciferrii]CCH46163.1 Upstream stimulatory factor 1 [Wickerhamomyces ciferrii]
MQVNKRSGEDIDHSHVKRQAQKETSVAEAALKYDSPKNGDSNNNSNKDTSKDSSIAIDSELLSHQSTSFNENADDENDKNDNDASAQEKDDEGVNANDDNNDGDNDNSNTGNNGDERTHARLSEQLTNYNALSNDSTNQRDSNDEDNEQQQQQSSNVTQQSPPSSNTSQQSPEQSTTQILHQSSEKPLAGSDEWHRIRKDNHKEVERRRRENINSGIKELSTLLPTQDTNKSQILQRAIEYIKRLKENENNNIEKWTLEKLLTDQAIAELTASNEKLKAELERAYREVEHWKKASSSK